MINRFICLLGLLLIGMMSGRVSAETSPTTETQTTASAPSATFTVVSTANQLDDDPGDGICASSSGNCTLAAAIEEANETSARDFINFNIPGVGPHIIETQGFNGDGLPIIINPVSINGISQSFASCPNGALSADIRIVIQPTLSNIKYGLRFGSNADGSLLKGLSVIGYDIAGILLDGADEVNIECNHIGVEPDGVTENPNEDGIVLSNGAYDNIIGGTTSNTRAERNVISGNDRFGVRVGTAIEGTIISGNYIGLGSNGATKVPNAAGIESRGTDMTIGGFALYNDNVISGNDFEGIKLITNSADVLILNNKIGTGILGIFDKGNGLDGIRVRGNMGGTAPVNINIGLAPTPALGNTIAFNAGDGVSVFAINGGDLPASVRINANDIYNNGQLGIDLDNNGITANDAGDGDNGANRLQNNPTIISAATTGRLTGSFLATGSAIPVTYLFELYSGVNCVDGSVGRGGRFLDSFSSTANGITPTPIERVFTTLPDAGQYVVMTATDSNGNTSEFGNCIAVEDRPFIVESTTNLGDNNPGDGLCATAQGVCSLNAAVDEVNALSADEPLQIDFDLGSNPNSIFLVEPLVLSKPAVIDGTSNAATGCPNPTTPGTLNVVLDGSALGTSDNIITLNSGSDGSEIRGLVINNSPNDGIRINSNNHLIACNLIGIDASGSIAAGNGDDGVHIAGGMGNRIGAIDDYEDRNTISGNINVGVRLSNKADLNTIAGNFIGTTDYGSSSVPNDTGIYLVSGSQNNTIGGESDTARNYVTGNREYGVWIADGSDETTVIGNTLGLNAVGQSVYGNGAAGLRVQNSAETLIGRVSAFGDVFGNLIGSNDTHGILLDGADDTIVAGNIIGSTNPLWANGQDGVRIENSDGVLIGALNITGRNYIYGNGDNGISAATSVDGLAIRLNFIGRTEVTGNNYAGNGEHGVLLEDEVNGALVMGNNIEANLGDGIRIIKDAIGNRLLTNDFSNNGGLGIDLGGDGHTPNDGSPDSDSGPNGYQNSPVITSVDADNDEIVATLRAKPNTTYLIEFVAAPSCTIGNYDGGILDKGSMNVTTKDDGNAEIMHVASGGLNPGQFVWATATDESGDGTSEFSQCEVAVGTSSPTVVALGAQTVLPAWQALWLVGGLGVLLMLTGVGAATAYRTRNEA